VAGSARFPFLPAVTVLFALSILALAAPLGHAADGAVGARPSAVPSNIVIGFVGGFVRHDNPHHGPVQFADRIRRDYPKDAYVRIFENRHRKAAYNTILRLLDRNHDNILSDEEKAQARIILFGHSWGASAAVLLARELKRAGIPVLLTVQVDSVRKLWQQDRTIPENVVTAVNFYQPHGLIHGQPEIMAADPARTQILGNYRFDYRQAPVRCESNSWFNRLTPSHAQSECDPHIWAQVEDLVRQRLQPEPSAVATNPKP
jgi:pimeloyl-ACP methyl ester carboxylesterase